MSQQPTVTDFQVVFSSVPRPLPVETWKNRATMFLVDDANPERIVFAEKPLSEVLKEGYVRHKELRTYRVAGLQIGPVLYEIPATPGMFVSVRPNASSPALSACEVFVDYSEDVKPQFANARMSTRKLGHIPLARTCLMAIFISGKLEMEMPKAEEAKLKAACKTILDYLKVSPTKTPLWAFIATMALVMDAKNDECEKSEVLQAVKYACDIYEKFVLTVKAPVPTEQNAASPVVLSTCYGGFQLDASPAPAGALLC